MDEEGRGRKGGRGGDEGEGGGELEKEMEGGKRG